MVYTLPIELRAVHPGIWKTLAADFETDCWIFWGTLGGGEVYVCREPEKRATGRPRGCTKDAAPGLGINANGTLLDTGEFIFCAACCSTKPCGKY